MYLFLFISSELLKRMACHNREAFLRCRRERYRLQREREMVEEREVRFSFVSHLYLYKDYYIGNVTHAATAPTS